MDKYIKKIPKTLYEFYFYNIYEYILFYKISDEVWAYVPCLNYSEARIEFKQSNKSVLGKEFWDNYWKTNTKLKLALQQAKLMP